MRERRRVLEATAVASVLSGLPSTLISLRGHGAVRPAVADLLAATRAAGTLLPPGRPGLVRGAVAHAGVSVLCGELLARTLPERRSLLTGAGAGLAIGIVNLIVIGRRFPQIRELPLAPQLADNVAFGLVFALIADRPQSSSSTRCSASRASASSSRSSI
jgi:hypothetical protein